MSQIAKQIYAIPFIKNEGFLKKGDFGESRQSEGIYFCSCFSF